MPTLITPAGLETDDFPAELPTTASLGDSGIVLGETDQYGCRWKWNPTNALGSKPTPREETGDNANRDGQWDATRFYGPRSRDIPGTCYAPDHASLHAAEQRLRDAISLAKIEVVYTQPGWIGYSIARQSGELLWTEDSQRHATFSMNLYSADPYVYSARERTFELAFPTSDGGAVWPLQWPTSWPTVLTSGQAALVNPGARPLPLRLTLTGPITTVVIANPDTGEALNLARPDGQPLLAAAETLAVDTGTHAVTLQQTAGRRSWAYGDWLLVPPGTSRIAIAGTADPAARVTGTFRAARL